VKTFGDDDKLFLCVYPMKSSTRSVKDSKNDSVRALD